MKLVDWIVAGVSIVIFAIGAVLVHALATREDAPAAPPLRTSVDELERRELEAIEERAEERRAELVAVAELEDDTERAEELSGLLNRRAGR